MSDNTECQETVPEVAETVASETKEQEQPQEINTEVEATPETNKEATSTELANNGNAETAQNGEAESATGNGNTEETEINGKAEESEEAGEGATTRKRKASNIDAAASDATEEKRPAAAELTEEAEAGGVHPDADMPLPEGSGDTEAAAIKSKTVEEVQAGSTATA